MPSTPALTLFEPMSKDAVAWLLRHVELYVGKDWIDNVSARLHATMSQFDGDDKVKVKYHRKIVIDGESHGRLYSDGAGMQMLWRVFRGALARHAMSVFDFNLFDIDMKKAHPTLFVQFCDKLEITCDQNFVATFVARGEEALELIKQETGCDRDAAKKLFNSILNFGTVRGWTSKHKIDVWDEDSRSYQFAKGYEMSFRRLSSQLMEAAPDLVTSAKLSLDQDPDIGSYGELDVKKRFMHIMLTSAEDDALMAACEYLNSVEGIEVVSYQYDGAVVKSSITKDNIDLDALTQHVLDVTGYNLPFAFKSFDDSVTIPAFCRPLKNNKDVVDLLYFENKAFFNDLRFDPVSGFYYQYHDGVWRTTHYETILSCLQQLVAGSDTFRLEENASRLKCFWTNPKQVCDISLRTHCLEENFTLRLDSSKTIFPFKNGCWDYELSSFRELTREDLVSKHAGWDYEPNTSQEGVVDFMEKLFPVKAERDCVSAYLGYALNPSKFKKKAMMFTDTVRGNTGKSKLMVLMKMLTGYRSGLSPHETLFVENKQLFLRDTVSSKNSHSAVTAEQKGCHLLCGDEMASSHKLDNVFCKDASGGTQALISGRHFNSKESFSFAVKFGMLLSFNQGCMPDLNQDVVLYERFLMAKCKTKFLPKRPNETDEAFAERMSAYEYCFEQKDDIDEMLMECRAAAFDYFNDYFRYNVDLLDDPPESFIEFRNDLVKDDNVLMDWFEKHFVKSDDAEDFVQVSEIATYLSESDSSSLVNSARKRKELFEMCLTSSGCVVHDKKRVRGESHQRRKVALCVRFLAGGREAMARDECED